MNDNQGFWNALNLLNIYSIYLAQENLIENRQQSAYNDVQGANDRQAEYLLSELNKRFDEQNAMLKGILDRLESSL